LHLEVIVVSTGRRGRAPAVLAACLSLILLTAGAGAASGLPNLKGSEVCYSIDVAPASASDLVITAATGEVRLRGERIRLSAVPRLEQGRLLVPVHGVAALAGVPVRYEPDGHRLILERPGGPVSIALADGRVMIGGEPAGTAAVAMAGAIALVDAASLGTWLGARASADQATVTLTYEWLDLNIAVPGVMEGPGMWVCPFYPSDWSVRWEVTEMPQGLGPERQTDLRRSGYGFTAERAWIDLAPGSNTLTIQAEHQHAGVLQRQEGILTGAAPAEYPIAYRDWSGTPAPDRHRPEPGDVRVLSPASGYTASAGPLAIRGELAQRLEYQTVTLQAQRMGDPAAEHRAELPVTGGRFAYELGPVLGPGTYLVTINSPPVIIGPRGNPGWTWLARFVVRFAATAAAPSAQEAITVLVDGRPLTFDVPPRIDRGRVLVPWRGLMEYLGYAVEYDAATRRIMTGGAGRRIEMQVESTAATLNGVPVELDVPAQVSEGRTLVPLRFVAEALGYSVRWDGATRRVIIETAGVRTPGAAASPRRSPLPPPGG
jgi:hypothetical protein